MPFDITRLRFFRPWCRPTGWHGTRWNQAWAHRSHHGTRSRLGRAASAFATHISDHPLIAHHSATGDGRPFAISDFLNTQEFHATGIYQHFYRQLGAEDQIAFILPDPRFVIGIALNRARGGDSERERQMLNELRPHLVQAYRNAEDFSRLRRSVAGMEALVEQGGEGLVLLNRRGSPEHWSPRAHDDFGRWFSYLRPGCLPEEVIAWLSDPLPFAAPPAPLLIDRGDRHPWSTSAVPDGEVLLVSEVHSDHTAALLHRLESLVGRQRPSCFSRTGTPSQLLHPALVSAHAPSKSIFSAATTNWASTTGWLPRIWFVNWSGVSCQQDCRSWGDSRPCPRNFYGFTNRNVPVVGEETFTSLPLPVA